MGTTIYKIQRYDNSTIELIVPHLPDGNYAKIVIKPNWVKHESSPNFPIQAMVTDARLLDAIISACLRKYGSVKEIVIGDAPLQGCDWDLLGKQAGIDWLREKYGHSTHPKIRFLDLRKNRVRMSDGFLEKTDQEQNGDPLGYRDVILDNSSFLEPISHAGHKFRVSDYEPKETISNHSKGYHRYLIAGSILDADLIINVPKMKCHQKAGITGALKNLVGINGNKAYLVHYRHGLPFFGGDEFPSNVSLPIIAQVRMRKFFLKGPKAMFRLFQRGWRWFRTKYGIEVEGTLEKLDKKFFLAGGSWYGNDTIWRMVYDLNRIVRFAPKAGGRLSTIQQRDYLVIVDGLVAGEGNGPLQPLPVDIGVMIVGNNPFVADMAMATMMGFDYRKIQSLANFRQFDDPSWAQFDPETIPVQFDGTMCQGIHSVPVVHSFLPPPGWRGHIELNESERKTKNIYSN